jgi:hypothetical protein
LPGADQIWIIDATEITTRTGRSIGCVNNISISLGAVKEPAGDQAKRIALLNGVSLSAGLGRAGLVLHCWLVTLRLTLLSILLLAWLTWLVTLLLVALLALLVTLLLLVALLALLLCTLLFIPLLALLVCPAACL